MMRKTLFLALAAACVAVVAAPSAHAICGTPLTFGQSLENCGGGFCYVVTPDGNVPSSGSFWSLGTGNTGTGLGDDNGTFPVSDWCRAYGPGCYLAGDWGGDGRIDGCIDGKIAPGKTVSVMGFQFGTVNAGVGYYAANGTSRNNAGSEIEVAASGQNIVLQPIPTPTISGTLRNPTDFSVQITLSSPALGAYTSDAVAGPSDVIKTYRVYKQVVPRDGTAPTSRDAGAGWVLAGTPTVGQPFTYTETACSTNSDIYLALGVGYDSGFSSQFVSANSTKIQCGPNLADPDRNFKLIEGPGEKPRPVRQR